MNYFAKNITFLRERKKLKQSDMLAACGFARTTWNNYENGISYPGFDDLIKIAKYFGLSETELIHTEITDALLIEKEKEAKNTPNAHLNTHGNTPLKAYTTAKDSATGSTMHEGEIPYSNDPAANELIRTQKFTIEMLKEALAAAQERVEALKKAKK